MVWSNGHLLAPVLVQILLGNLVIQSKQNLLSSWEEYVNEVESIIWIRVHRAIYSLSMHHLTITTFPLSTLVLMPHPLNFVMNISPHLKFDCEIRSFTIFSWIHVHGLWMSKEAFYFSFFFPSLFCLIGLILAGVWNHHKSCSGLGFRG